MTTTRLSFSAVSTYTACGYKYFLRYRKGYRGKTTSSALLFGGAVDKALNVLLLTKNLEAAMDEFDKGWHFQYINKAYTSLPENTSIIYSDNDFDQELLFAEDVNKLNMKHAKLDVGPMYLGLFNFISKEKKEKRWDALDEEQKRFFNYANWLCLYRKGQLMLESYNQNIMPRIKDVIAVQYENLIENQDGDKIIQYVDLVVKWEDDTIVLFDNKTAAKEYEENSAAYSPQLLSYYHGCKELFNIEKVGFIVMKKAILKNKVKVCSTCEHNGSGERFKTCNQTANGKRCGGEWKVDIKPECEIQVIVNDVPSTAEDLVMTTFDEANQAIKKENWYRNLAACNTNFGPCEYWGVCWKNDVSDVLQTNEN